MCRPQRERTLRKSKRVAGLLGIAIERQQADAELQSALDHQAMLTREISHRVKNSLASVVGLLRVQARNAQSEDVQNALKDAASRIAARIVKHQHGPAVLASEFQRSHGPRTVQLIP